MTNISVSSYQQVFEKADANRDGIMSLQELDNFQADTDKSLRRAETSWFPKFNKMNNLAELITTARTIKKDFEVYQRYNPANISTGITLEALRNVAALDYDPALGDNDIREHNLKARGAEAKTENTPETKPSRADKREWEREDPNNPANNSSTTPARRFATTSNRGATRNAFVNNTNPYGPIYVPPMMNNTLRLSDDLVQANALFLEDYNKKLGSVTQKA